MLTSREKGATTPFKVRIGINLGPVKVVKSISGQLNPLGDGINNAQRIMSFAKPNQILVSRSFYDVIACLSDEYAQLFQYAGMRKDKHVKQHLIYEVMLPGAEHTYATVKAITEQIRQDEDPLALAWDPGVLKTAEDDLAVYIGPLAKVLVGRAAQQATNAKDLYTFLGNMIPVDGERAKFLAKAPALARAKTPATEEPNFEQLDAGSTGPDNGRTTNRTATTEPSWGPAVLTTAEQELALHLGPLSKVLVKKAAKKTSKLEELYELLANELPTKEQQNAFLNKHKSAAKP